MKLLAVAAAVLALGAGAHRRSALRTRRNWGRAPATRSRKIGNNKDWSSTNRSGLGSFTHQAEIPGLYQGKANVLQRSDKPMRLATAPAEPDYRWNIDNERGLSMADFLARQRIMGLIIVKDGVVQVERYQYDRQSTDRFTSHSMAKSITALAIGYALDEGTIATLDDRADRYAPKLRGTIYGETTIRNLLRMASGAQYEQSYDRVGDTARFNAAIWRDGIEAASWLVTVRQTAQGARFAAVMRGATGMPLSRSAASGKHSGAA